MDPEDPTRSIPVSETPSIQRPHMVIAVAGAVAIVILSHALVFVELVGGGTVSAPVPFPDAGLPHFGWVCGGCGLALMFAAFAMLR